METMINLTDLLKHEILDLYSVEEQIIEALPKMIEKAKNPQLKKALREHLKVTEEQKRRLDKVKQTFGDGESESGNKGFFSRLFGGGSGGEKCKGMEGIISEGEKIMKADITDEALDAAIIASAQKVEHYEICGYGTARAFARELKLAEVEKLLAQTLNEEYAADDLLTSLAVGKLNIEAENASGSNGKTVRMDTTSRGNGKSKGTNGSSKSSNPVKSKSSAGSSKSSTKSISANSARSKSTSKGASKSSSNSGSGMNKSSNGSASNKGASKSGAKKSGKGSSKTIRAKGLRLR